MCIDKRTALLGLLVLIGAVLVACGPTTTPPAEQPAEEMSIIRVTRVIEEPAEVAPPAQPAPEGPAAGEAPAVITFMSWAEGEFELQALQELVERYEETHPGIQVDLGIVTDGGRR